MIFAVPTAQEATIETIALQVATAIEKVASKATANMATGRFIYERPNDIENENQYPHPNEIETP